MGRVAPQQQDNDFEARTSHEEHNVACEWRAPYLHCSLMGVSTRLECRRYNFPTRYARSEVDYSPLEQGIGPYPA
jgi:hypothetical protein